MSLYLKYRPKDFESLFGQEFIKTTLQTALAEDKVVSSYLLCGPRGTGKTTTARILAKGMNCVSLQSGNPCDNCDNCIAFNQESLIDIIEIDAASHTGVDNIREIIERAQFQPTKAKFKIYIVDEVHMLSKGAFNALLKTLEEPPKHVKFILATTETHKVPDTIISRCQRYDFKSINEIDIKKRLSQIAELENVEIDQKSLDYIAKASGGALRNAISLFEQLIESGKVSYDSLVERLGLTDNEVISQVYQKLLSKDLEVLKDISDISTEGKNIQVFYKNLLAHAKQESLEHLGARNIAARLHIMSELNKGLGELKHSFDPEVTIMMMLSKILGIYKEHIPRIVETEVVVEKTSSPTSPSLAVQTEETPQSLTDTDVFDIFGEDSASVTDISSNQEGKEKNTSENSDKTGGGFDNEAYVQILRDLKVKGALVISLKQARSFNMFDDYLEIVLQNNFTLKAMNTSENILDLIKGLEKMGISGKTVKLC